MNKKSGWRSEEMVSARQKAVAYLAIGGSILAVLSLPCGPILETTWEPLWMPIKVAQIIAFIAVPLAFIATLLGLCIDRTWKYLSAWRIAGLVLLFCLVPVTQIAALASFKWDYTRRMDVVEMVKANKLAPTKDLYDLFDFAANSSIRQFDGESDSQDDLSQRNYLLPPEYKDLSPGGVIFVAKRKDSYSIFFYFTKTVSSPPSGYLYRSTDFLGDRDGVLKLRDHWYWAI